MAVKIPNKNNMLSNPSGETAGVRRIKYGLSVTVFLLSTLLILAVVNWIAAGGAQRFDLTAMGHYSLSEQTRRLVESLEEPVEITLLFAERDPHVSSDEQRARAADRRQVEDVLREFWARSDKVEVVHLDPTNPRHLPQYDALVERLEAIFADEIEAYTQAVADGRAALNELAEFGAAESQALLDAVSDLQPTHPQFRSFQTAVQVLAVLAREVETIDRSIEQRMTAHEVAGLPFPDLEGAVSTVHGALRMRSTTLNNFITFYRDAVAAGDLPPALADRIQGVLPRYEQIVERMTSVQERIDDLDPLRLAPITVSIQQRNCVLLTGANNAVVLPYDRLFPPPSARELEREGGIVDRRFAGESVIAAGLRQLTLPQRPTVVFVHSEQQPTIRRGNPQGLDVLSASRQLEDLGFEVQEWNVFHGSRPPVTAELGKPVWVVVPPMPTGQPGASGAELALAASRLISDGENVLVSFFPSLMPGFGQREAWGEATEVLGVTADTGRRIFEQVPQPGGRTAHVDFLVRQDFRAEHPVGAAVRGQPTFFVWPLPLRLAEEAQGTRTVLLEIEPTDRVFATSRWMGQIERPTEPQTDPYPLVVAVERGTGAAKQRCLLVGSGAWFWTMFVGEYDFMSGLPTNPGNNELFAASVAWLAGLDEMIARSPRAQAVSRIEDLSPTARTTWNWIAIGGLPLLSLFAGAFVTWLRRG